MGVGHGAWGKGDQSPCLSQIRVVIKATRVGWHLFTGRQGPCLALQGQAGSSSQLRPILSQISSWEKGLVSPCQVVGGWWSGKRGLPSPSLPMEE